MDILKLERVSMTPCYDSKWYTEVKDKEGNIEKIYIQRLDIQKEDVLRKAIEACETFEDVRALWVNVYFD